MTSKQAIALERKRDHLVAKIAYERALIAQNTLVLRRAAAVIDKINEGIRYLKKHPEILFLPAAVVLLSRPRRLWSLALSGLGLWRMALKWRHRGVAKIKNLRMRAAKT